MSKYTILHPTWRAPEKNDDVSLAKKYPIEKLYKGQLGKEGRVRMGCCPLHDEQTPSFAIYPETNSWYCFAGCGGGDVITLYMRLQGVSFKQAVEELK